MRSVLLTADSSNGHGPGALARGRCSQAIGISIGTAVGISIGTAVGISIGTEVGISIGTPDLLSVESMGVGVGFGLGRLCR